MNTVLSGMFFLCVHALQCPGSKFLIVVFCTIDDRRHRLVDPGPR